MRRNPFYEVHASSSTPCIVAVLTYNYAWHLRMWIAQPREFTFRDIDYRRVLLSVG
jgi:hypothetical protein